MSQPKDSGFKSHRCLSNLKASPSRIALPPSDEPPSVHWSSLDKPSAKQPYWPTLLILTMLCITRPTCPCCRESCCTAHGSPSRTRPSTWPSMSSCCWTPAPPPRWTPPSSCWTSMTTASEGPRSHLYRDHTPSMRTAPHDHIWTRHPPSPSWPLFRVRTGQPPVYGQNSPPV